MPGGEQGGLMQAFDVAGILEGFDQDHVYLEPLIADSLSVGVAQVGTLEEGAI